MTPPSAMKSGGQIGSLLASLFFICAGLITLYDTTSYTDRDSQVFPQTVAIILVVTAAVSFIARFLKPSDEGGFGTGIWWRRVLLIMTMFLMCFLIPKIGFLPAGVVAFSGGLIAAMHEGWRAKTLILYPVSGAVVITAFYVLFKFVLYVPLP
ncbi:MAG: tripartite tricarboxylate transporter TctB family protein [Paracoccaceae bacterium]